MEVFFIESTVLLLLNTILKIIAEDSATFTNCEYFNSFDQKKDFRFKIERSFKVNENVDDENNRDSLQHLHLKLTEPHINHLTN